MNKNLISIKKSFKSLAFALNGLRIVFQEQNNARIHVLVALIVIIAGVFLKNSAGEWIAICFAIGMVLMSEIINSAIEHVADFVSPDDHPLIKKIKDLSAGAVLISAITAIIIGIIIYLPKIISLCSRY
jgi:undecaprenol kinase/diacylglycerol kinase (ATP)